MTVVETILVFALIPLAIYGVITLLTLWPKAARIPRYRPGQEWKHPSVWWTGNPVGVGASHLGTDVDRAVRVGVDSVRTARGGARGSW